MIAPGKRPLFSDPAVQHHFDEQGYAVCQLLPPEEVDELRQLYFDKANLDLKEAFEETSRQLDAATNKIISDKIKAIFEKSSAPLLTNHVIMGGTFFIKKARSESEFPIHQDWNLVDEGRFYAALIWCPLQDVTTENGAIMVIPGSHKFFSEIYRSGSIHPPRFPSSLIRQQGLEHALKTIHLKAGQALIYQNSLYHGSHPNTSGAHRLIATGSLLDNSADLLYYHWPSPVENYIQVIDASDDFYLHYIDQIAVGRLPAHARILKTIPGRPYYPTAMDLIARIKLAFPKQKRSFFRRWSL